MRDKIIGHILHRDFFDNMRTYLENMSKSRLEYLKIMKETVSLLQPAVFNKIAIANHTISQDALLTTHMKLMTSTDMQLVYLAHLAKVVEFMPDVATRLGSEFVYEAPNTIPRHIPQGHWLGDVYCSQDFTEATESIKHNQSTKVNFIEWDLESFSDYDTIKNAMAQIIMSAYTNIGSLRHLMSPQTLNSARENDLFSMATLGGELSQVDDIKFRIECTYFALHQQALNIYPESVPIDWSKTIDANSNPTEFISDLTPNLSYKTQHERPRKSKPHLVR